MNKLGKAIVFGLMAAVCFSCKDNKKEEPDPVPQVKYTTLAELLASSTSTSADFDINIKDLTVTAVYKNYVQLEDGTAGAQLVKQGHEFKAGQVFTGKVTGKARTMSGGLSFSALETGAASVSTASSIPCKELSLPEVLADRSSYLNRRIKVRNVTFVNGFTGAENGAGIFSQQGVQISATCRPEGLKIEDGAQGDIICYPASGACYVYDVDAFTEHEIDSPLARKSVLGVYTMSGGTPSEHFVCRPGVDQYAYGSKDGTATFRIQNYAEEWIVVFSLPSKLKAGQKVSLDINAIGTDKVASGTMDVFVEKVSPDKVWLMDYASNKAYILNVE